MPDHYLFGLSRDQGSGVRGQGSVALEQAERWGLAVVNESLLCVPRDEPVFRPEFARFGRDFQCAMPNIVIAFQFLA